MSRYYDDGPREMTPASERLLLALSCSDKGDGVNILYLSRGRYHWDGPHGAPFNRQTFQPLYDHGLVQGWDRYDSDGPARLTEAGREYAARLAAQEAEKRARRRKAPDAESPAALRALAALAEFDGPVTPYSGDVRGIWRLGSRDGYGAKEVTFYALRDAGYVEIIPGDFLARRLAVTDAGRARLARRRA